jgi:hypothetical protein
MKKLSVIFPVFLIINIIHAQNVGIGTNTPTYPLTVIGVPGGKGIVQKTGTVEVGFYTSATAAYVQTWSNHPLLFSTSNGSPQMTLNVTGLGIGIGDGNLPSAKLDVDGNVRIRSDIDINLDNV